MKWPSAHSHSRIAAARIPSRREAAPLHVAARPTTTLRPAYGSSSAYSAFGARAVAERTADLGEQRHADQPVRVARELVGGELSNSVRASSSRPSSTSSSASAARHACSIG